MKKIMLSLIMFCFIQNIIAQVSTNPNTNRGQTNPVQNRRSLTDDLYIGGALGGGVASNQYAFEVSPFLGYYIDENKRFSIGAGPILQFQGANDGFYRYRANTYGMRTFARFDVIRNPSLFTQVEADYQYYLLKRSVISSGSEVKFGKGMPGLYAGAGLNMGGGYIMALYNFLWTQTDADQGYAPPVPYVIRFGINFNLGR